ncbi:MAG: 6-bladed beta-propeller [bacterium]|nr:6-bladed beta-propeller [bacterium]
MKRVFFILAVVSIIFFISCDDPDVWIPGMIKPTTEIQFIGVKDMTYSSPVDMAMDKNGNIYICDRYNDRVLKFDSNLNFLLEWGESGTANGQFDYPEGIGIDPEGNVWVPDPNNNRVQKFDSQGNFIAKIGNGYGEGNYLFDWPSDVAIDSKGYIYIVDMNNCRIVVYNKNYEYVREWGEFGTTDTEFKYPISIAIDKWDNIYVCDEQNLEIKKFTRTGTFLKKWASDSAYWADPYYINVDDLGYLWVAERGNGGIHKFSPEGKELLFWRDWGPEDYQITETMSILTTGNHVFVLNVGPDQIKIFEQDLLFE